MSEGFNCSVLEITTAGRADALAHATGIGFYYDGTFTLVPLAELQSTGAATFENGDSATLHRFGALALCWAGSMSSSMGGVEEFKPFVQYVSGDTCYLKWDAVPANYRISPQVKSFNRWTEVMR